MKNLIFNVAIIIISFSDFCLAQCPPVLPNPTRLRCGLGTPCGIYVIQNVVNNTACPGGQSIDNCYQSHPEYYEGIFVKFGWDDLQPNSWNSFNQTLINKLNDIFEFAAVTNGYGVKNISIGIVAGNATPPWATALIAGSNPEHVIAGQHNQVTQFGNSTAKEQIVDDFPIPWDNNYQNLFMAMIANFKFSYLDCPACATSNGIRYIDLINMVKLTGVNIDYEEMRLPNEDNSFEGTNSLTQSVCADDWVKIWTGTYPGISLSDKYTPARVQSAFENMSDFIRNKFANKYVSLAVVRDPHGFPPIDCNSIPYLPSGSTCTPTSSLCLSVGDPATDPTPPYNVSCHLNNYNVNQPPPQSYYSMNDQLIKDAIDRYAPCLAVNLTALDRHSNSRFDISIPNVNISPYALIGYQQHRDATNDWDPVIDFKAAIENALGVNGGPVAKYLELFPNTINFFADPAQNIPNAPKFGANWMDWAHRLMLGGCGLPARLAGTNTISIKSDPLEIFIVNEGIRQGLLL